MLQPLPLPAIEHLARGLEPVQVPAGQAVFGQGDPADRFYVIETGAADVLGDGHVVATLGPGDGFGEIALLRRVPRTATVRAATDLQLQALTSDRFLPVVTGFPPSAREAGTSMDTMLDRYSPEESTDEQDGPGH
jgi:CRP-like cAMP-binding protein